MEGSEVSFVCSTSGIPRPSLEWTSQTVARDDYSLSESFVEFDPSFALLTDDNTESGLGVTTSVLNISNAEFPVHNGSYTCNGSNINPRTTDLHYNSSTVYVTILGRLPKIHIIVRFKSF